MLVLLWARSPRLVFLTNYPALWLTASLVPIHPIHRDAFIFYAAMVVSSAIQWAVIGLLFRAICRRFQNESAPSSPVSVHKRRTA
jgi:predicted cobalt transporter CbtA